MISQCAHYNCDNIFQHSRVEERLYCCRYCRVMARSSKGKQNKNRIEKLYHSTYIPAALRSDDLKKALEKNK